MDFQQILHNIAEVGPDDIAREIQLMHSRFAISITSPNPMIFIPKYVGDHIGESTLERTAMKLAYLLVENVQIRFDPRITGYCIAPIRSFSMVQAGFRILKEVTYTAAANDLDPSLDWYNPIPAAELTTTSAANPSNATATSSAATPKTASVNANKASKTANCFILFRRDRYEQYCMENPDPVMQRNFSGLAAEMWRNATPDVKAYYSQLAQELKQQADEASQQQGNTLVPSVKRKRQSQAASGHASGESSGQSSGSPSGTSLSDTQPVLD